MRELKHEEIADFPKDPNVGDIVVTLLAKLEHYPAATADFFDPKVASIHIIGNLHQGGDEKHGDFLIWRMGTDVHCGFFALAKAKSNNNITVEWECFIKSIIEPVWREGEWTTISPFRRQCSKMALGHMWTDDTTIFNPGNAKEDPIDPNKIRLVSSQFAKDLFKGEAWEPKNHRKYLIHVLKP